MSMMFSQTSIGMNSVHSGRGMGIETLIAAERVLGVDNLSLRLEIVLESERVVHASNLPALFDFSAFSASGHRQPGRSSRSNIPPLEWVCTAFSPRNLPTECWNSTLATMKPHPWPNILRSASRCLLSGQHLFSSRMTKISCQILHRIKPAGLKVPFISSTRNNGSAPELSVWTSNPVTTFRSRRSLSPLRHSHPSTLKTCKLGQRNRIPSCTALEASHTARMHCKITVRPPPRLSMGSMGIFGDVCIECVGFSTELSLT